MRRVAVFLGLSLTFLSLFILRGAGSQEDAEGEKALYGLKPKDYVLPPGARELKLEKVFPSQEDEGKGIYLSHPQGMCAFRNDSLFVSDVRNNEIYVFDFSGKYLRTIGRLGQGPGDLAMPSQITFHGDQLIVRDMGNKRIQIFDQSGVYQSGFRLVRDYYSIVAYNGRVYAAPIFYGFPPKGEEKRVVDMFDLEGRLIKYFGEMIKIKSYDNGLNYVNLALGVKNEIWLAFEAFPVVRRYSLSGDLIKEYRYAYGIVAKKESFNKKMAAESSLYRRVPYYFFNTAIYATAKGLYLLIVSDKRLDILLMDQDGHISEFYWLPRYTYKPFACKGLVVSENGADREFYVLDMASAEIDVLSIK